MDQKNIDGLPKAFEKKSEQVPMNTQGISSLSEFRRTEEQLEYVKWLQSAGLAEDEIDLYYENEAGVVEQRQIESSVLRDKLESIYEKINSLKEKEREKERAAKEEQPSTSADNVTFTFDNLIENLIKKPTSKTLPGHPMNDIKDLENEMFGHLTENDLTPVCKKRKILRRMEKKKDRILNSESDVKFEMPVPKTNNSTKSASLWDMKELPQRNNVRDQDVQQRRESVITPRVHTLYTIKDSKIVRLEPVSREEDEYRAVDLVVPVNDAESRLLEGTKMSVDDIRKLDRFKDWEPGIPSKVLYLKNLSPSVSVEQLSVLLNQFVQENRGPIDVRLMTGRMRGQAFVGFENEETALRALEEVNGTIMQGKPIIVQFGRNSNRINEDNR